MNYILRDSPVDCAVLHGRCQLFSTAYAAKAKLLLLLTFPSFFCAPRMLALSRNCSYLILNNKLEFCSFKIICLNYISLWDTAIVDMRNIQK